MNKHTHAPEHTHAHTHMHMHTHTCALALYTHLYTCACTHMHVHTHTHTSTHTSMSTHTHMHVHTHTHTNTYMHSYYSLLYSPTTTACGHSFCRICLSRSFDFSPLCPVCRSPLAEVREIYTHICLVCHCVSGEVTLLYDTRSYQISMLCMSH